MYVMWLPGIQAYILFFCNLSYSSLVLSLLNSILDGEFHPQGGCIELIGIKHMAESMGLLLRDCLQEDNLVVNAFVNSTAYVSAPSISNVSIEEPISLVQWQLVFLLKMHSVSTFVGMTS